MGNQSPTENEIKAAPQIEKLLIQRWQKTKNNKQPPQSIQNTTESKSRPVQPRKRQSSTGRITKQAQSQEEHGSNLDTWFDFNEIKWRRPKYTGESEIPYLPTTNQLDNLIAALGKKTAAYCQLLKETGARPGEISPITIENINFQMKT